MRPQELEVIVPSPATCSLVTCYFLPRHLL
jgi:hypothetical protein